MVSAATLALLPAGFPPDQRNGDKEFVIRRAATNRVLNVLRHWVSKHSQVPPGGEGLLPLGCGARILTGPRALPVDSLYTLPGPGSTCWVTERSFAWGDG